MALGEGKIVDLWILIVFDVFFLLRPLNQEQSRWKLTKRPIHIENDTLQCRSTICGGLA